MSKKQQTDEELQRLWEENVGKIAYEVEEAMLEVFRQHKAAEKPAIMLGSIAIAAGHFIQAFEKNFGYRMDLKAPFNDVLMQAYDHYRQHPSDEEEKGDEPATFQIDWSMMN